ncbi:MAG TPA: tRNA (adenosine(37)-N6)-threonylcarbamoyltransferase complex transferase subunit TsaD [Nautiliaceae bacterium]|nr:tRNA (adenosine(37)-N6)-threonylcarbamoyltransferase complex transferase subunit TsaD [Nautiliaceae bacterium]
MIILGVEGTAHTLAFSLIEKENNKIRIISDKRIQYKANEKEKGIKPSHMAEFHFENMVKLFLETLKESGLSIKEIDAIAYSAGPGFGHTLRQVAFFTKILAKKYNKKVFPVNHLVAHLEIGRIINKLEAEEPLYFFVSGANTLIAIKEDWYKVLGETIDIGVGNFLDKVGRLFDIPFPAGPKIEELAMKGNKLIELPYTIKGMDLSLAGLVTKIKQIKEKYKKEDIFYSLQEHLFSMLIEILERALAYTEKDKVVYGGGVLANKILRKKLEIMAKDFGVKLYEIPIYLSGDNATMIASSIEQFEPIDWKLVNFDPYWRIEREIPSFLHSKKSKKSA